jgi:hypothetical protein
MAELEEKSHFVANCIFLHDLQSCVIAGVCVSRELHKSD